MKRQMKIAAVVSATALLAIGASFTSMAAAKTGTWAQEDGVWYCYDKNGDVYENEFCMSNGVELYVGEDGELVTNSWVEHDGNMYYIGSAGTKTINAWKELTPYEDEDADTEWYYFGAAGKRVENTKKAIASDVYGTETFYFDGEGKVIYGWVEKTAAGYEQADGDEVVKDLIYTNERGARVEKRWFQAYEPSVNVEEDDLDGVSQKWYYAKSLGSLVNGKQNSITGATYLFNNDCEMVTGWVAADATEGFIAIDTEDVHGALSTYDAVYYTCDVDGHVKKGQWIYDYANTNWENDPDKSKYYFFIEKDGKVFVPAKASESNTCVATDANAVDFVDGEISVATDSDDIFEDSMVRIIDNNKYLFNADGQMMTGLKYFGGNYYYFGKSTDGAMKTGAQTIADSYGDEYKFYFGTEDSSEKDYIKGAGVTGNANGKLYKNGLLVTANGEYKYDLVTLTIDGKDAQFIVNKNGSIQTSKNDYKDDSEVIIDLTDVEFVKANGAKKDSIAEGEAKKNF